eukprot:12428628-Karenia_brevis.AAC.1
MYTDARMGVDPEPIATDASSTGGGSCVGVHLDPKWYSFWQDDYSKVSHDYRNGLFMPNGNPNCMSKYFADDSLHASTCDPFVLVSLFDGIGGILQACTLLGLALVAIVICESSKRCRRVTRSAFNVSVEICLVEDINFQTIN